MSNNKLKQQLLNIRDMEWISVKDRLPNHQNDILVQVYDDTIFMARYREKTNEWMFYFSDNGLQFDDTKRMTPIFWTELPPNNN